VEKLYIMMQAVIVAELRVHFNSSE